MSLATRSRRVVPINLLPAHVRSAQNARRILSMAAVGAGALVVLLVGITVLQRVRIGNAEETLRAERARAAELRTEVDGLKEFDTLQTAIDSNRQILAAALTSDISWSRFLDDLDSVVPADSWLSSLTVSAKPGQTPTGESSLGTAQYAGYVTTFPGLAGWLDTMSELDGLRFVYLSQGKKQDFEGRKVVSFGATAHVTDSMLSNRCQKEDAPCP